MKKFLPQPVVKLLSKLQFQGGSMSNLVGKTGPTAAKPYRYPAPGSQGQPVIPEGPKHRTFDTKYYPRDARHAPGMTTDMEDAFGHLDQSTLDGHFAPSELIDNNRGSAGNKNEDVLRYNPDGLRSAMSASWEAMEAELATHAPTQLPHYEWEEDAADIIEYTEARGLPPVPGRRTVGWGTNPRMYDPRW